MFIIYIFYQARPLSDSVEVLCNYGLGYKSIFMLRDIWCHCQRLWRICVMFLLPSKPRSEGSWETTWCDPARIQTQQRHVGLNALCVCVFVN